VQFTHSQALQQLLQFPDKRPKPKKHPISAEGVTATCCVSQSIAQMLITRGIYFSMNHPAPKVPSNRTYEQLATVS
jgi:hypothetical protein